MVEVGGEVEGEGGEREAGEAGEAVWCVSCQRNGNDDACASCHKTMPTMPPPASNDFESIKEGLPPLYPPQQPLHLSCLSPAPPPQWPPVGLGTEYARRL